jgi:hypothetical protein
VYELAGAAPGGGAQARQQPPQAQLLAQLELPDAAPALRGMAWVGGRLALCAGMRYLLAAPLGPPLAGGGRWSELLRVPEELAYSPAMLAAVPERAQAVLVVVSGHHEGSPCRIQPTLQHVMHQALEGSFPAGFAAVWQGDVMLCSLPRPAPSARAAPQGPAGILVDAGGSPVGSAVRLEGLGATPRAMAASGALLLVVSEGGMHVFESDSGGEVQRLGFGPGLHPAPGQPLHASAAEPGGPAAAAAADDVGGGRPGCVAVAGRRLVWLCVPVSPADQARELLGQRQFEPALELVQRGLRRGAAWAQAAAAQAALLLLHGEAARPAGRAAMPACVPCSSHRPAVCLFIGSCDAPDPPTRRQSVGLARRRSAWTAAPPPPSSPRSSSPSSQPTPRPGPKRCPPTTGTGACTPRCPAWRTSSAGI